MARRRYQEGTLFLRGTREKKWVGRWLEREYRGTEEHQVRRSEVLGTLKELPTKKLARRALDARMASVNSMVCKPTHNITFNVLAEKWKTTVMPNHKPSSQNSERGHMKRLCGFFGPMDVRGITGEVVQRFVQANSELKPKTIRNLMTTFKMIWKTSYDWGYVDRDERAIMRSVRLPDIGLQSQPVLTPEQAREIISKADEPYRTMFWLVAETGMRGGEVTALSLDDLDLENRIINVKRSAWRGKLQTPKTLNAIRTFPISANLAAHLAEYLKTEWKANPNGLLFTTIHGQAHNNGNVVRFKLHPILDAMKIEKPERIGLHALRHGSASLLDSMNVPIAIRKERLGHSNFSTTLRYTHAVGEDHRKVAMELGQMFDPNCPKSTDDSMESTV